MYCMKVRADINSLARTPMLLHFDTCAQVTSLGRVGANDDVNPDLSGLLGLTLAAMALQAKSCNGKEQTRLLPDPEKSSDS